MPAKPVSPIGSSGVWIPQHNIAHPSPPGRAIIVSSSFLSLQKLFWPGFSAEIASFAEGTR
jgi:hypothetical protein